MKTLGLLVAQSVALAVALTWPLVRYLDRAAVGSAESDTVKHLWNLWWMRYEALHGTPGLLTTAVNFPDGMQLYPIEPLNGLVALLVPLDPVPLSNVLALVHVTLVGLCTAWLALLVSESRLGAHAAGALAQASAFVGFTLHVGVGELRQTWWIPLGLAILVRAHQTRAWAWFLALGATLAACVLSCFYHGLFLALAVAVWALLTLRPVPKLVLGYAVAAGMGLAIAVPTLQTFSTTYEGDPPAEIVEPGGATKHGYRRSAAHLDHLVAWRDAPEGDSLRQERAYTGGRYLGWLTLLLAVLGLAASPRKALPWLAASALGITLALGSVIWWKGEVVTVGGRVLVLPFAWLNAEMASRAEAINFPARFLAIPSIALPVMAALAMRWRWLALLVPLAAVDMVAHDLVPWPRAMVALPSMEGLSPEALASAGILGPIADLSLAAESNEESRLRAVALQVAGQVASSGVPVERLDSWGKSGRLWLSHRQLTKLGNVADRRATPMPEFNNLEADIAALRERGYAGVAITFREMPPDSRVETVLNPLLGSPVRGGHALVWSLAAR